MDMPLQHAHPDVLRAMLRPGNGERYLEIIDEFRARVPGITMRSTFIVGFPGETRRARRVSRGVDRASAARPRRLLRVQRRGGHAGRATRRTRRRARSPSQAADSAARGAAPGVGTRARSAARFDRSRARRGIAARFALRIRCAGELGASRAWFGRSQGEAPGVDGGIYFTGDARVGEFADVVLESGRSVRLLRTRPERSHG